MPNAPRLIGNLTAFIALVLGLAYLIDRLWMGLGGTPWVFCALLPILDIVLGHTVAVILAMVGLVVFVLSGFKDGGAVALVCGALFLSAAPGLLGGYLGAYCGAHNTHFDRSSKTDPVDLSGGPRLP